MIFCLKFLFQNKMTYRVKAVNPHHQMLQGQDVGEPETFKQVIFNWWCLFDMIQAHSNMLTQTGHPLFLHIVNTSIQYNHSCILKWPRSYTHIGTFFVLRPRGPNILDSLTTTAFKGCALLRASSRFCGNPIRVLPMLLSLLWVVMWTPSPAQRGQLY